MSNEESQVLPARSITTLRTLGSLARFRADKTVPKQMVEMLHQHVVTEWPPMLDILTTFKMVQMDGPRVYLTELGAETARKLTAPVDEFEIDDMELVVTQATNLPCFAQSFDAENTVCQDCPVVALCRESAPSRMAEVAFALQHADDQERERVRAAEEARRRQERIEQEREARRKARENAPSLNDVYQRLRASADAKKEAQSS